MSTSHNKNSRRLSSPKWLWILIPVFVLIGSFFIWGNTGQKGIDYSTQVKPILNKNCIHCHGGVKQSGGFSLLNREQALAATDSEHPAIVPFEPENSELIKRLTDSNPERRMPFENEPLPEKDIQILTQWIAEGAEWGTHWAYKSVEKVELPHEHAPQKAFLGEPEAGWGRNGIDQFILEKMKELDLSPNIAAQKHILLRRVSLDLTGLPPKQSLTHAFLAAENPISYEALVDSLLASPGYGERWAGMWMDLARYADSKGFERDFSRDIWEYRDYVIRAFNQDLPYDQFITEQLAGDLLENPTDAQYIATGFHRNTTTNDEGGTNNEEFRTHAILNRVNTTWEALMGTTFACVQCHGHPYDPIPHESYYEFMAFLNNTRDYDTHPDYPWLRKFSEVDQEELATLKAWISQVDTEEKADEITRFLKTWQPIIYSLEADSLVNAALYDTKYLGFRYKGMVRFKGVDLSDKKALLMRVQRNTDQGRLRIHLDKPSGEKVLDIALDKKLARHNFYQFPIQESKGVHDLYLFYDNPSLAANPDANGFQFDWLSFVEDFPGKGDAGYEENKDRYWKLLTQQVDHTLIMIENPADRRRKTYVFDRGNWLTHNQEVQPDVPDILPPFPEGAPRNRLGLAQWITDSQNPLTARTMVNRIWEQLFGRGLAETLEDLGTQGLPPTHPKLLDYLAWRYMHEYGWSTKKLLKEIVLSETYRQSSKVSEDVRAKDPYNTYYARGPRIRLSAEQIRDQALAISGLLSKKMYGPPVMPYQPEGIWAAPYNSQAWKMSEGEDRYRRALYTFVKRGSPYPVMETFDVGSRQVCNSRRIRTNTPLQALLTLNDPVFLEAARYLAQQMNAEQGKGPKEKIGQVYKTAFGIDISKEKLAVLTKLYEKSKQEFESQTEEAQEMIGEMEAQGKEADIAAFVLVSNALLNLDELLTK